MFRQIDMIDAQVINRDASVVIITKEGDIEFRGNYATKIRNAYPEFLKEDYRDKESLKVAVNIEIHRPGAHWVRPDQTP